MQYKNAYKKEGYLFKTTPPHQKMPNRSIITNKPDTEVCNNSITTSKYNIVNFLPLNLIVQFSKVANIYFVLIGIMQMIPAISVSGGFPVIFIPLSMVISVSVFKDFFQDLKRKASDMAINNKKTQVLDPGIFRKRSWREVYIGNIIKVKKDQQFPADVILLKTADEKQSCFIETKNLDGETNLKYKKVKSELVSKFNRYDETNLGMVRQEFKYQRPNPYIHSFTGSHAQIPLDNNNIVLRGCTLKITEWCYGLVIYTGVDTKIMLNSNKTRQKKSRLQFRMGIIVAIIFLIQMLLTFLSSFISIVLTKNLNLPQWSDYSNTYQLLVKWGSWILLFTNFVPISLIVSLEMVKYIQGINMSNCKVLVKGSGQLNVQTSTLNEQLGQIQHLFSDKTGTLTCNYMSFKHMMIGSKVYGYGERQQIPADITNVDFHDPDFLKYIQHENISRSANEPLFDMLIGLSMCHNVIIEDDGEGNRKYNASSPDQLAFINMAKYCLWQFMQIDKDNTIVVRYNQQLIKYKLLHLIQFNSDRKRMSVILQKQTQVRGQIVKRIFIYSKGADNVMFKRLKQSQSNNSKCEQMNKQLQQWSVQGLRTLVFSKRQIKEEYYAKWAKMYAASLSKLQKIGEEEKKELKSSIIRNSNRVQQHSNQQFSIQSIGRIIIQDFASNEPNKQQPTSLINKLLNDDSILTQHQKRFLQAHIKDIDKHSTKATSVQLQEILQRQMQLIGITAIQDKLQDNVKSTIIKLREAGIKIWMLTGDKKQTAINIGISCGIIAQNMGIVMWQSTLSQTVNERNTFPSDRDCCLVVTGEDLLVPSNQKDLLQLINSCRAIICCRVTPKQKQDMVWLMRKNKYTTLGIGDGANDVNMINTAHVGVGIKGVQGAQAALCSDYAISQFQIIGELLLYHGRQCYRKNSQLILFNFYKNLLLVLPQLWYGYYNHFSSTTIYDPWIYQLYNVAFTSLPIIIFAIFDERYTREHSLKNPKLYEQGIENRLFNYRKVFMYFVGPVKFSLILTHLTFAQMDQTISSEGYMYDLTATGMCIFAECVFICNIKVLLSSFKWSYGLKLSVLLGIVLFYFSIGVTSFIFPTNEVANMLSIQIYSPQYWLVIFQTVSFILLIQYAINSWQVLKHQGKEQKKKGETQVQLPLLQ